ncbi:YheT family hydrolase [Leucothrix arctica]|uniref:Alpha/beta hydrolase n=1 Tax=Leucothrix arctica TaxID=1481894 RepID=A0A317C7H2_9GAMM|nr:alpha/beta fold hydrolase [Leucothrix arctica]PWQ94237.1 alpha/beta hydrolase [Leucothrix arctica]
MSLDLPSKIINGHVETLLPYFFRPVLKQPYQRERITTPDDDFLDLDWLKGGHSKLLIISHGLESSSHAKYVQGIANLFKNNDYDVLAWNYRGCSGEINRTSKYYHSGATYDLETVMSHVQDSADYQSIYLVGFSLGGNLTLKYAGEQSTSISPLIKGVCAFSTPCDLRSSSHQLATGFNKVYTQNFVKSLKQKVLAKETLLRSEGFDVDAMMGLKNLPDFDDVFTGPLHGFKDADDYYQQCSSLPFIESIAVPTLLVNAVNDPFLSLECYPYEMVKHCKQVTFEAPMHGGHVGFYQRSKGSVMWSEWRALQFFKDEK